MKSRFLYTMGRKMNIEQRRKAMTLSGYIFTQQHKETGASCQHRKGRYGFEKLIRRLIGRLYKGVEVHE